MKEEGRRRRKAWRAARSLVSSPAVCFLPQQDYNGWDIKVLGQAECEARKMGAYLAVGQGSKDGPEFIHLSYKPKGGAWPAMLACMPSHFFDFQCAPSISIDDQSPLPRPTLPCPAPLQAPPSPRSWC